jgi:hypothetical protein
MPPYSSHFKLLKGETIHTNHDVFLVLLCRSRDTREVRRGSPPRGIGRRWRYRRYEIRIRGELVFSFLGCSS